jgi:hypothetical protein
MKTKLAHTCIIAAALSPFAIPAISAAEEARPVIALNSAQDEILSQVLGRGASEQEVRDALGEPGQKLARNVWVYYDYEAIHPSQNKHDCDALVVVFASGKVKELRLAKRVDIEGVAAKINAPKAIATAAK